MLMNAQTYRTKPQTYAPGFHMPEQYGFKSELGLSRKIVEQISEMKGEPEWMRKQRFQSLALFEKRPIPTWGRTSQESGEDLCKQEKKVYVRMGGLL